MKKILTLACVLFSFSLFAQDSTMITISPQTRDIEYIYSFAFNDYSVEGLVDSMKVKYRIPNPPTGNTTVSITGYTLEWFIIFGKLKHDQVALNSGTTSRIDALLRAVGQPYLTGKMDAIETGDTNNFQSMRQYGRSKLRRNNN